MIARDHWRPLVGSAVLGLRERSKPAAKKGRAMSESRGAACAVPSTRASRPTKVSTKSSTPSMLSAMQASLHYSQRAGGLDTGRSLRRSRLSGGTMERPAAPDGRHRGRPDDVVIIYKIDRLTRSLTDCDGRRSSVTASPSSRSPAVQHHQLHG